MLPTSRRTPRARRLASLPALVACCALVLTACGDDGGGSGGDEPFPGAGQTSDRLDAVTISGDVGTPPEVEWKSAMDAGEAETETITEGDGEPLADGDSVLAHLWIGNGYSKQEVFSTYAEEKAELLTVDGQLPEFLAGIEDAPVGSRLAVTASAEAFGPAGNAQLGIGNQDTALVVIDLVSAVADAPEGEEGAAPEWMPRLKQKDGVVNGFDFEGTPEPTADLRRVQLVKGTGPRVKKGQTIAVRYLGQAFGEDKPFDENYGEDGKGAPTTFSIGTGQVIPGWDQGLDGVPVGSRVVLEIPPDLGYGAEGSEGIPKNATLVFVIDVLAAA